MFFTSTKNFLFYPVMLLGIGCSNKPAPAELILDIPVIKVLEQDVPILSIFTGQTYGEEDIQIAPRVKGLVQSVNFIEGSFVKKGQLLYTVEPYTYQNNVSVAQANLAAAKTNLAVAKTDFERIDLLVKMNAVSQRELEGARGKYEACKEQVSSGEAQVRNAQIDLGYCSITSPIDGIIGISKVQVGDYVSPGPYTSINTISNVKNIRVRFTLNEQEFLRLFRESKKENSSLSKGNEIQLQLSDGSDYSLKGSYSFADRQVDPSTGAITLQALFPNPNQLLRPGQYVKILIEAQILKNTLVIPQRSVIEMQGISQVYVLGDSNKVNMQIIETGPSFKDAYIVESGLTANDKIAFGGTQLLKNGSKINPKSTEWQPGAIDNKTTSLK